MSDWTEIDLLILLLRVTIVLSLGILALKWSRSRRPSLAVMIARAMLVALWVGPLIVLSGWTLRVAVLPPAKIETETVPEINSGNDDEGAVAVLSEPASSPPVVDAEVSPASELLLTEDVGASIIDEDKAAMSTAVGHPTSVSVSTPIGASQVTHIVPMPVSWSPLSVMILVWLVGSGWMLVVFAAGAFRTWQIIRSSESVDPALQQSVDRVAADAKVRVPVVRTSSQLNGPCTTGLGRVRVLLPSGWSDKWSEEELRMILAHELTHARFRDSYWDVLARFSRCFWWFHPLVLLVMRYHRLACEHRCDAAASQIVGSAGVYRTRLAQWALQLHQSEPRSLAALAMADRPHLIQRLRWLEKVGKESRLSLRGRALACFVCLVVLMTASIIQPTQRVIAAPQPPADAGNQDEGKDDAGKGEQQSKAELNEGMIALGLLTGPIVWGDEPLEVDWGDMQKLAVHVSDQQGNPLAQASVTIGTIHDKAGTMASLPMVGGMQTDDSGVTHVLIPAGTGKIGLHVSAPGYATNRDDFTAAGKIEVRLQPGRTFTVRATDPNGRLLANAFPMVEKSQLWGREFKQQPNGTHLSPDLPPGRRWMRVVDTSRDDGVVLFSELIDLDEGSLVDDKGVLSVTLKPGVRLEGSLNDSVQRPVKQGFVELYITDGGAKGILGDGVEWQEQTEIRPDGSFVFLSLPPDTHAQLFVLGDGYQSRDPTLEEFEVYSEKHGTPTIKRINEGIRRGDPLPTLVYLDQPVVKATMPCRETAGLNVRVVDPAGRPIEGATATMSPNLYFFGELAIPGLEGSTRYMIDPDAAKKDNALSFFPQGQTAFREFVTNTLLQVKTDKDGIARFRNIPSLSESFEIASDGYVMAAYPTSKPEEPGRYGLARNLKPGKVVTKTITMERDMPRTTRELTVIYSDGRPLKDVTVTITDISTSEEDDTDWQQWSVQRFGEVSSEKTDKNGRVVLWYPQQLDGDPVQSLRLYLSGRPENDVYFYSNLNVPAKADGNVIKFTPEDSPRTAGALRVAKPEYIDLAAGSNRNAPELVRMLLREPNMIALRQLLALNKFDAAKPLTFKANRNTLRFDDKTPVIRIDTDAGWRIVVLTDVRPKGATWVEKPPLRYPPEAAFVFDGKGKLLNMIGGGRSAKGDYEDVMLTHLGSTGDYFIRTSAFESHPPFEQYSRWYRIGAGDQPSLSIYNYANATAWSGVNGASDPIAEFGYTQYEFNGKDIPSTQPGSAPNDARVPRQIVWDGRRNKWLAEETQSFNGQSLYRVLTDDSAEFVPVTASAETIVAAGGRRDFENWHLWTVTVQDGQDVVARLQRRDADGQTIEQIREDVLKPGLHKLQLHIATDKDEDESTILVMCNAKGLKDRTKYKIPAMKIDDSESVAGQAVYVASPPPLRLFDKRLAERDESLVWVIEGR